MSQQPFSPRQHELLAHLCGEDAAPLHQRAFWDELLLCGGLSMWQAAPEDAAHQLRQHAAALAAHSAGTHAYPRLLHEMARRLRSTGASASASSTAAINALFLVRALTALVLELTGAKGVAACTREPADGAAEGTPREGAASSSSGSAGAEGEPAALSDAAGALLAAMSCELAVTPATYAVKLEAVQCIAALMSAQRAAAPAPGGDPFTRSLLRHAADRRLARSVVQHLLQLYISSPPVPLSVQVAQAPAPGAGDAAPAASTSGSQPDGANRGHKLKQAGKGLLRKLSSAAGTMLALPLKAANALLASAPGQSPLADAALRLLLLLLYAPPPPPAPRNPFRAALDGLQDARYMAADSPAAVAVSYAELHAALGSGLADSPPGALLLYGLLVARNDFKEYFLICSHPEEVVLPLLEQLYHASSPDAAAPAASVYVLLICCLIMSQDSAFASQLFHLTIPGGAAWYKERPVPADTSLGNILTMVLLRAVHNNLGRSRDPYLSMAALACLSNLSPHFASLSSHTSQRLVMLLDMLQRRYHQLERSAAAAGLSAEEAGSRAAEVALQADLLQLVLELTSAALVHSLRRNPELAYTLLHRQDMFRSLLRSSPQFSDYLANVLAVVDFFNDRVEARRAALGGDWSVDCVLEVIQTELRTWHPNRLTPFPGLVFSYEELDAAHLFFVPYVWQLTASGGAPPGTGAASAGSEHAQPPAASNAQAAGAATAPNET
eukprot:jgi/Tetstr1/458861/TSEL_004370.t1